MSYFALTYFPGTYFGGARSGDVRRVVDMAAELQGWSNLEGNLGRYVAAPPREAGASGGIGTNGQLVKDERDRLVVDLAAQLRGSGHLSASPGLTIALAATLAGSSTMRALPVVDISRLRQRREEEELLAALLLAVA